MINILGQVMLYVNDQDKAVKFWTEKLGFHIVEDKKENGLRWIAITPNKNVEATNIILHNKEEVSKMNPEMNVGTPSLIFYSNNFDNLYKDFVAKNINVGKIVDIMIGKVFNFSDDEGNYFAVMEKN